MFPLIISIPGFIAGIILLYKGSDILVDGTVKTAAALGISSLIISLLAVAFGTSAPEFTISFGASLQSHADISVGNIIGSCIANFLLVLGISAILQPIHVEKEVIRREMPILLAVTIFLIIATLAGLLDYYHYIGGIAFLIFFAVFIYYFFKIAKKERLASSAEHDPGDLRKNTLFIILGIAGVVFGAWLLIESAITIASFFSIPEIIIAMSMVAIGTSLPELAVSVAASYKNEGDIAVGNTIGSNIFNILLVLGACALILPLGAIKSINYMYILLGITVLMFPIIYTGRIISRREGILLLGLYIISLWYIFFI